jgi:transposase
MEVLYPRCAGLDVHKATVVAAVRLVVGGKVVREVRTFATTTAGLLELAAWLGENGCTHVAMEATGVYWRPVWHVLAEGGFVLVLANAAQVKNVPGRKTDVGDATWLAELLAHGLVRASFVPDAPTAELRALLRTRKQLVRERAGHVLRLQKTLEDANVKLDGGSSPTCWARAAGPCSRRSWRARPIPGGWRRSPIRGSARRRSGCGKRCAGG